MVSLGMMTTILILLVTVIVCLLVLLGEPAAKGVWVMVEDVEVTQGVEDMEVTEGVEVVARDDVGELKFRERS